MTVLELAEVTFGRYNDDGRQVETIVSRIDIETGMFFPEPVELGAGTWFVLYPGGILCTTPLIVKHGRRARFDKIVPA